MSQNPIVGFKKLHLNFKSNLFEDLAESAIFEDITSGRQGANLAETDHPQSLRPLVRSTTIYQLGTQPFVSIHRQIQQQIQLQDPQISTNNALIEIYNHKYTKMGYHSDQALDLNENSFICLFSCYNNPLTHSLRTLRVISKDQPSKPQDMLLEHNSVVIFSVATNQKFKHQIILEPDRMDFKTQWLGLTLRESKTYIKFSDNGDAIFNNRELLKLAEEDQKREYYHCRSQENKSMNYTWPNLTYTISPGDLIKF